MMRQTRALITGTGSSIPLMELRWLVGQAARLDDDTQVMVSVDKPPTYHPTDIGSVSLSVDIPARG